eukprot:CFRG3321T1
MMSVSEDLSEDEQRQLIPYMSEHRIQLYRHNTLLPAGWRVIHYNAAELRVVIYNAKDHQIAVRHTSDLMPTCTSTHTRTNVNTQYTAHNEHGHCHGRSEGNFSRARRSTFPAQKSQSVQCPSCQAIFYMQDSHDYDDGTRFGGTDEAGDEADIVTDPNYFHLLSSSLSRVSRGRAIRAHALSALTATVSDENAVRADATSMNSMMYKQTDDMNMNVGMDMNYSAKPLNTMESPACKTSQGLSSASMNDGYYRRFFVERAKIGSGLRGAVFRCTHIIEEQVLGEFAVKKIPVGDSHDWFVSMLNEVHMLEKLHHENIVDYKHAWLEHEQLAFNGPSIPCLFILIEYANSGNLAQYIWEELNQDSPESEDESTFLRATRSQPQVTTQTSMDDPVSLRKRHSVGGNSKKKKAILRKLAKQESKRNEGSQANTFGLDRTSGFFRLLEEAEVIHIMHGFTQGLAHLHKHNIIHRDLKPQNLLLHRNNSNQKDYTVLVSDFGECEMLATLGSRTRLGNSGTFEYIAPELLENDNGVYKTAYDAQSDMFSVGVVMYVLLYGRLPWKHDSEHPKELANEILNCDSVIEYPDSVKGVQRSCQLVSLLRSLLSRRPADRPTAADTCAMFVRLLNRKKTSCTRTAKPVHLQSPTSLCTKDDEDIVYKYPHSLEREIWSESEIDGMGTPPGEQTARTRTAPNKNRNRNSRNSNASRDLVSYRSELHSDSLTRRKGQHIDKRASVNVLYRSPSPPHSRLPIHSPGFDDLSRPHTLQSQMINVWRWFAGTRLRETESGGRWGNASTTIKSALYAIVGVIKLGCVFLIYSPTSAPPLILFPLLTLVILDVYVAGLELQQLHEEELCKLGKAQQHSHTDTPVATNSQSTCESVPESPVLTVNTTTVVTCVQSLSTKNFGSEDIELRESETSTNDYGNQNIINNTQPQQQTCSEVDGSMEYIPSGCSKASDTSHYNLHNRLSLAQGLMLAIARYCPTTTTHCYTTVLLNALTDPASLGVICAVVGIQWVIEHETGNVERGVVKPQQVMVLLTVLEWYLRSWLLLFVSLIGFILYYIYYDTQQEATRDVDSSQPACTVSRSSNPDIFENRIVAVSTGRRVTFSKTYKDTNAGVEV